MNPYSVGARRLSRSGSEVTRARPGVALGLVVVALAFWLEPAQAQVQTEAQAKCIVTLNKDVGAIAAAQAKANQACVKNYARGMLTSTLTQCVDAESEQLAKLKQKTLAEGAALCSSEVPSFAYSSAPVINAAAQDGETLLLAELFGGDLAAVSTYDADPALCRCQINTLKKLGSLGATARKLFQRCKKNALATASTVQGIADCIETATLEDSIAAHRQEGGKIAKAVAKLGGVIGKNCDASGVSASAFSGCGGMMGDALRDCLATHALCRVCETFNSGDALNIDCDLQDDGVDNLSCAKPIKRVFLSSETYTGAFGGVSGADARCQSLADSAGLGGTWFAWLSDSTRNVRDRVGDVEYRLVNGTVVALSKADLLDGSIRHRIDMKENGSAVVSSPGPWTGTDVAGAATAFNCTNWTASATVKGSLGSATSVDSAWTASASLPTCSSSQPIFCFEQ